MNIVSRSIAARRRFFRGTQMLMLLSLLASCGDSNESKSPADGGVRIDADVPGTKVYLGDRCLGTVPLLLTGVELDKLGLPRIDARRVEGRTAILRSDGWGEGLFIGFEDVREHRIHLLAPRPDDYLKTQTPWGMRTKHSGGEGWMERGVFKARLKKADAEVFRLMLEPVTRNREQMTVRVSAANIAGKSIAGFRPELHFCWGGMETPWRTRSTFGQPLPPEWSSFLPDSTHRTVVTVPCPETVDGVSLFCVLHLFQSRDGNSLIEGGAVYGDSLWLPGTPKKQTPTP